MSIRMVYAKDECSSFVSGYIFTTELVAEVQLGDGCTVSQPLLDSLTPYLMPSRREGSDNGLRACYSQWRRGEGVEPQARAHTSWFDARAWNGDVLAPRINHRHGCCHQTNEPIDPRQSSFLLDRNKAIHMVGRLGLARGYHGGGVVVSCFGGSFCMFWCSGRRESCFFWAPCSLHVSTRRQARPAAIHSVPCYPMAAVESPRVTDRACPRGRGVEQQHTAAASRGSYVELVPDRLRQKARATRLVVSSFSKVHACACGR
jgi:hypothetical protein